jgi:cysteine desulfurase/selenocysteine lyase
MRSSYAKDFGRFSNRIWFNCAHQGPLPKAAVSAAQLAITQKISPCLIQDGDFTAVPHSLKASLACLIGAKVEDIILGNSTSYGLHVLRNGLPWSVGDEVLVVQGDFPATIYPWLGLQNDGVQVRLLAPRGPYLTADELEREVRPFTRLLCVSWVNSLNGSVLDFSSIGQICRKHGIIFVLNGSQGVGARQIKVEHEPIDALVSCGYKWLCGPYGTGFCWIKPELRNQLRPNQTYWLPQVWQQHELTDYTLKKETGSAAFDLFCTANFLNFIPWRASVDFLLGVGVEAIEQHNAALADSLISNINQDKFRLISPASTADRSAIVVLSHVRKEQNLQVYTRLAEAGIDIAFREGNLRSALHLYNTPDEVARAVEVLNSVA